MFLFVCLFWSYFYCYVKINVDALNVSGVSQDSRGRTNGECGDKGSVSTFGVRQSVRLLTRSWKHGSVHVHIFRGTCKMCWTRVGVQRSFPQMSKPPPFIYLLPDVFEKFVIISMLCFFSSKPQLEDHNRTEIYVFYLKITAGQRAFA